MSRHKARRPRKDKPLPVSRERSEKAAERG